MTVEATIEATAEIAPRRLLARQCRAAFPLPRANRGHDNGISRIEVTLGDGRLDFERLWAPWRLDYITGSDESSGASPPDQVGDPLQYLDGADTGCFLCRDAARYEDQRRADRTHRVVQQTEHTITVLNIHPYNNGHLLIAPRRHASRLEELNDQEHREIQQRLTTTTGVLERGMNADGFNIGLNLGRAAGAGLPDHLHWHVVPRWQGDSNFMPVLAGTRVIPQSLDALWEWLSDELAE